MARGLRLNSAAWLALAALLGGLALAGSLVPRELLDWQPARWASQPWRAFTAAAGHLSAGHLGANLLGLLLVVALGREAGCNGADTAAWALAWPLTHLALLAQPALTHYAGLSGVLHAGVAVAAWRLALLRRGGPRAVGAALLAGLLAKIVWESPWLAPVHHVPGWAIPIAPLAHATGVAAGTLTALVLWLGWRR